MILCGTDFTGASYEAARAAAAIAARVGVPLALVHVLDFPLTPDEGDAGGALSKRWKELFQPEMERRRTLLENEADRLTESGADVRVEVVAGAADEALIAAARERDARLIVVASLGRRNASAWRLGSVADRLALSSPVPVLVVRDARPFEVWSDGRDGGRPLRVLLGVDFGRTADAAADWVAELKTTGPCEVVAGHVYEPDRESRRLGLEPAPGEHAARARLEATLREVWDARLAERVGEASLLLRPRAASAHVADVLVELSETSRADLIVLGTHQRKGFSRHWHGSVSYSVLPLAATNVVVVPAAAAEPGAAAVVPRVSRVLAATDLSQEGNRAVRYAYALAPRNGSVTLLHVLLPAAPAVTPYGGYVPMPEAEPSERAREASEIEARLAALVPEVADEAGVRTHLEVVHAPDVAEAVCQAAERLSCDLVCMSTHAHGAVASTLLGSAAQGVVRHAGRPVLLVGPPPQP